MERTIISFDYAIKGVLRDKANFDILSGFLTELLEKQVTVKEVLESEGNTETIDGKVSRLDLKAKIDDDEFVVFEIQFFDKVDFMGKILFNACKAVVEQIKIGEKFDVKKVYSINISYYGLDAKDEYVFTANLTEFKGIHFDEVIPFSQNLEPTSNAPKDIHPEYFLILPRMFEEEEKRKKNKDYVPKKPTKSKFDEWVYVLKNSAVKSNFTAAGIQAAGEKLDILKMTPQQKAAYEADKQALATQKTQLQTAELKGEKRGLQKGEKIGLQKGEKIGLQKGEKIGLQKGEKKGLQKGLEKEKKEAVVRGHKKGHSIDTIAEFTDLSNEEIIKILKENGLA